MSFVRRGSIYRDHIFDLFCFPPLLSRKTTLMEAWPVLSNDSRESHDLLVFSAPTDFNEAVLHAWHGPSYSVRSRSIDDGCGSRVCHHGVRPSLRIRGFGDSVVR
jgi:hypothetical protein